MGGDAKLLDTTQDSQLCYYRFLSATSMPLRTAGDDKGACSKKEASSMRAIAFPNYLDNYKMIPVVRNDLNMGKGKIGSQCGHGAVGAYQKSMIHKPNLVDLWERTGCAKIALKIESEKELQNICRAGEANGLIYCVIHYAGRTQIEPNSKTVLGIGPASARDIGKVTCVTFPS